jgi:hypothetical protein
MPDPYSDGRPTATAIAAGPVAFQQLAVRSSFSGEYAPPSVHPAAPSMGPHGPADMQRLFAAPAREEQRTITAQSLRRRVPLWAVAVGSAGVGLVAFTLVVVLLARGGPRTHAPTAGPSAVAASAPAPATAVPTAPSTGPFVAARVAFASVLVAAPPPTNDAIAPASSSALPPAPPPPAPTPTAPPAPIPTTNVASLPVAAAPKPTSAAAAHAPAVVAVPQPTSTTAAGSGTLKVICFPGCDQVIDNGSALGPSPIIRRTASIGSHRLKLVWSDASKVVSTVVIADQTATVRENHP